MLRAIGVPDVEALLVGIPKELRLEGALDLPAGLDDVSLMRRLEETAARSRGGRISFLGGGAYRHLVHPVVDQLLTRSEVLTPYTPYQPEASQGTLQAIFEFQTMVSEILGLEVANASMYDGASAAAEAALMARRVTRRERVLLAASLPPQVRATARTYLTGGGGTAVEEIPFDAKRGTIDLAALRGTLGDDAAALVVGYPNYFGIPEDLPALAALCGEKKTLLVTHTGDPFALGMIESPGAAGADIAVAEGQPLGLPVSFGGPGVGLFAARTDHLRQMPGRLCGKTVDGEGRTAFVLTLSTREQHIRREKATSNICTNQGLCALAVTIHLSLCGPGGFETIARKCHARARRLAARLGRVPGVRRVFDAPYFHEIAVRHDGGKLPAAARKLEEDGILLGVPLGVDYPALDGAYLSAVTECTTDDDIERAAEALEKAL
jgi:glycine dehydrogenase subunit 1